MLSLQLLHDHYCQHALTVKNLSPRTIYGYKEAFNNYLKFSKKTDIQQVDMFSIEQWIFNGSHERNWKAKTIRNRLMALSIFFEWCVKREIIDENPSKRIDKPRLPKSIPRSLKKDKALDLLDWVKHLRYSCPYERFRAITILNLFIFTGIRKSELTNIKIHHINLAEQALLIECGKGNKDRLIPINDILLPVIKKYLKAREKMNYKTLYFFASTRRDGKIGEKVLPRLVEKLRDKSGIYFSSHMLRHTFATLMLEGGCDIYSLSKMMGHSDIKTTTIYLSATVVHLQKQIRKHPLAGAGYCP